MFIYRKKKYAQDRELESIGSYSPPPVLNPNSALQTSSDMLHSKSTDMLVEKSDHDPLSENTYDQLPALKPLEDNDYDQLPALKGKN